MKYEEFKRKVKETLREQYPDRMIQEEIVYKVNEKKENLIVRPEEAQKLAIPNIYLEDFYEIFQQDQDFQKVMQAILQLLQRYTRNVVDPFLKKENLMIQLVPKKRNQELLKTIPYVPFQDLACIYRYILKQEEDGVHTVLLTNDLTKELHLEPKELHEIAMENTRKWLCAEVIRLSEVLYVVTTATKLWGATTLIFPETLAFLGEKIKGSFYILPSSLHEFMAVPQGALQPEALLRLLKEGNRTTIQESEFLSSSIYHYDIFTKQVEIVANYDA